MITQLKNLDPSKKNNWKNLFAWVSTILPLTFSFFCFRADAEYRVYQFYIQKKGVKSSNTPVVISALPPYHYAWLHGGVDQFETTLLRTWICPGDTGARKKFCDSPYKQLNEANPQRGLQ
jgi:hypothetical protein